MKVGEDVVAGMAVGVVVVDSIEIRPTTRVHLVTVDTLVVMRSLMVDLLRGVVVMVVVVIAVFLFPMEMVRMENVNVDHMNVAVGQAEGKSSTIILSALCAPYFDIAL